MANVFRKALQLLVTNDSQLSGLSLTKKDLKKRPLKGLTEHDLIRLEGEIGSELFGPVPSGHRRSFFNLDAHTWIWHEEWTDAAGKKIATTTRYEVQPKGILKVQEGSRYSYLEGQELINLNLAVQMYYERIMREIYSTDPTSGQKLA